MSSTIKSCILDLSLLCSISQMVKPGVIMRTAEWYLTMINAVLTLIYYQMLVAVSYRGWALLTKFWTGNRRCKGTDDSKTPHIWRLCYCLELGHDFSHSTTVEKSLLCERLLQLTAIWVQFLHQRAFLHHGHNLICHKVLLKGQSLAINSRASSISDFEVVEDPLMLT